MIKSSWIVDFSAKTKESAKLRHAEIIMFSIIDDL